jgi:hypothetical protein
MTASTSTLLTISAGVIAAVLGFFFFRLKHWGLFRWTSAGFWAWSAFALYFVISPVSAVIVGDLTLYDSRLAISGGDSRAFWILCVAITGIFAFFLTYLRTTCKPIRWGIRQQYITFTPPVLAVMMVFLVIGLYSLLAFRAGLIDFAGEKIIEGGRFTGSVTGYANVAHKFIFVPMFLFLLSRKQILRWLGLAIASAYFVFSLPHSSSRFITVSLFIALSIHYCLQNRKKWPRAAHVVIILLAAMVLQIKGHVRWEWDSIIDSTLETTLQIPAQGLKVIGGSTDSAMLSSWYVKSYLEDQHIGYDYGLPLINYFLTGWIPNRFFPEKYFLVDWLRTVKGSYPQPFWIDQILHGAKYTLLGSFYGHGGIIAVVLCMAVAGYLCRRLDGMFAPESPLLVKAVAVGWFSTMWMDWGSGDNWVLMNWGSLAIPGIVLWFFWRKVSRRKPILAIRQYQHNDYVELKS